MYRTAANSAVFCCARYSATTGGNGSSSLLPTNQSTPAWYRSLYCQLLIRELHRDRLEAFGERQKRCNHDRIEVFSCFAFYDLHSLFM